MTALQVLLYRVAPFCACLGALAFARWSGVGVAGVGPQSTTIALGFLLVGAFLGGAGSARAGLPRITGYLVVGFIIGPHVTGLLTKDMVAAGKAVEGIAVALIALTAGGEIDLGWVRKHARRLALITASELTVVAVGVFLVVFLGRALFPFAPADDIVMGLIVAMVFGAIAVANSPTVTIAVIAENHADGPVSRTVLGVTVIKDVAVIVLFAVAMAVAKNVLDAGAGGALGWTLTRELGGSVLVGVGIGMAISLFLRFVGRDTPVFILATCFAISQIAAVFHLEALLVALTAGIWVENFSGAQRKPAAPARGETLIKSIERLSTPVYAMFFAFAGAKVDLDALAEMWPLALLLVAVRALCVYLGTAIGTRVSGAEPVVVRYAWLGFISQAGVTLALSAIVAREFPTWGAEIQILVVAMIALHEFIGPIGFQYALRRAGECDQARPASADSPQRSPASAATPAPTDS
ncbi:MAG TPA: cation:proton antiporter [Kofleriaceae bacterium]|nr:cation:proton antiporter [Kofleriaceae bacterium]